MIDLTAWYLREILSLDPKTGALTWNDRPASEFANRRAYSVWRARHLGKPALISEHKGGYLYGSVWGRKFLSHRVVWAIHYGEWPQGQIDHIDGNPSNNAISNLRDVDNATNGKNQKLSAKNSSGAMGVCWNKQINKWQVRLGKKYIGVFADFDHAVSARKAAEAASGYHPNHGARA